MNVVYLNISSNHISDDKYILQIPIFLSYLMKWENFIHRLLYLAYQTSNILCLLGLQFNIYVCKCIPQSLRKHQQHAIPFAKFPIGIQCWARCRYTHNVTGLPLPRTQSHTPQTMCNKHHNIDYNLCISLLGMTFKNLLLYFQHKHRYIGNYIPHIHTCIHFFPA